jgi:hypothetical protein
LDETRTAELKAKAAAVGLSEQEAGELGRLLAEAEGKPYSDAATERAKRTAGERAEPEPKARRRRRGLFGLLVGKPALDVGATGLPGENGERDQGGTRGDRGQLPSEEAGKAA